MTKLHTAWNSLTLYERTPTLGAAKKKMGRTACSTDLIEYTEENGQNRTQYGSDRMYRKAKYLKYLLYSPRASEGPQETESPRMQKGLVQENRQCWCGAVTAVSNFDFVYNYHDNKTRCAKHLIAISRIIHTPLFYRKLNISAKSFLFQHAIQLKVYQFFHCISFIHRWSKIFLLATIILIDFTLLCTVLSNKSVFG